MAQSDKFGSAEFTIRLDHDELATIRSCLLRERMKEDRAIARGEKLGVRRERIQALLTKLPLPE